MILFRRSLTWFTSTDQSQRVTIDEGADVYVTQNGIKSTWYTWQISFRVRYTIYLQRLLIPGATLNIQLFRCKMIHGITFQTQYSISLFVPCGSLLLVSYLICWLDKVWVMSPSNAIRLFSLSHIYVPWETLIGSFSHVISYVHQWARPDKLL